MNKGLKNYTKQLTQEVGGASCSVNLNKEDANLHIQVPLIKTVGLNPIDLSLIFNLQDYFNQHDLNYFGRGSRLNLYTKIVDDLETITVTNADGSVDVYYPENDYNNIETKLRIEKTRNSNNVSEFKFIDKFST